MTPRRYEHASLLEKVAQDESTDERQKAAVLRVAISLRADVPPSHEDLAMSIVALLERERRSLLEEEWRRKSSKKVKKKEENKKKEETRREVIREGVPRSSFSGVESDFSGRRNRKP